MSLNKQSLLLLYSSFKATIIEVLCTQNDAYYHFFALLSLYLVHT